MRSSVFSPIEPVAPKIVTRFGAFGLGTASRGFGYVNTLMTSPHQQTAARARWIAQGNQSSREARKQEPIDPVEQAAMAWNQLAHIFGSELSLHRALAQIAELAERGNCDADKGEPKARSVL